VNRTLVTLFAECCRVVVHGRVMLWNRGCTVFTTTPLSHAPPSKQHHLPKHPFQDNNTALCTPFKITPTHAPPYQDTTLPAPTNWPPKNNTPDRPINCARPQTDTPTTHSVAEGTPDFCIHIAHLSKKQRAPLHRLTGFFVVAPSGLRLRRD